MEEARHEGHKGARESCNPQKRNAGGGARARTEAGSAEGLLMGTGFFPGDESQVDCDTSETIRKPLSRLHARFRCPSCAGCESPFKVPGANVAKTISLLPRESVGKAQDGWCEACMLCGQEVTAHWD